MQRQGKRFMLDMHRRHEQDTFKIGTMTQLVRLQILKLFRYALIFTYEQLGVDQALQRDVRERQTGVNSHAIDVNAASTLIQL